MYSYIIIIYSLLEIPNEKQTIFWSLQRIQSFQSFVRFSKQIIFAMYSYIIIYSLLENPKNKNLDIVNLLLDYKR